MQKLGFDSSPLNISGENSSTSRVFSDRVKPIWVGAQGDYGELSVEKVGNPCWLDFVGLVCANKWFRCREPVVIERRICGIRRDQKFKIGLIRSYENLLRQKIRIVEWRRISGWWGTYTTVHTSNFSLNFPLSFMCGWCFHLQEEKFPWRRANILDPWTNPRVVGN